MAEESVLLSSIGSAFSQWFLDIVIWIVILGAAGYFGYRAYVNKMLFKYTFVEWYDHKNFKVKKGRLIKNRKGLLKFQIKGYNDPTRFLPMCEPNGFFNGHPCRNVCWDGQGNLVYLSGIKISKEKYLESALTPIERTEAIDAQMESAEKGITLQTMAKWALSIGTIIVVMLMVSVVMVAKYGFEQSSQWTSAVTNMVKVSENQKNIQEITKDNTIAMNNLASVYAKMFNVTINQEIAAK